MDQGCKIGEEIWRRISNNLKATLLYLGYSRRQEELSTQQRPQNNSSMIFDLHTLISLGRNLTDISIKRPPRMD